MLDWVETETKKGNESVTKAAKVPNLQTMSMQEDACTGIVGWDGSEKCGGTDAGAVSRFPASGDDWPCISNSAKLLAEW